MGSFVTHMVQSYGILAVSFFIFAETGLMMGIFFPGDTLLLLAGLYASKAMMPLIPLLLIVTIAAFLGNTLSYHIGKVFGKKIFIQDEGILFNKKHLIRVQHFFVKYGDKAILFSRFSGYLRAFAPIAAGMGEMDYRKFMLYNGISAVIWVWGLVFIGIFLGLRFPQLFAIADQLILLFFVISTILILIATISQILIQRRKKS